MRTGLKAFISRASFVRQHQGAGFRLGKDVILEGIEHDTSIITVPLTCEF